MTPTMCCLTGTGRIMCGSSEQLPDTGYQLPVIGAEKCFGYKLQDTGGSGEYNVLSPVGADMLVAEENSWCNLFSSVGAAF